MTKRFNTILMALLLAITSVFAGTTNAFAEDEQVENLPAVWLQISPVSNRVALISGDSSDYEMTVSNIGSGDFAFHVYAAPYSVNGEDYNVNFSNETNRTQISRWIRFYQEDGVLTDRYEGYIEKGQNQTIKYNITVPENIPAGGQYAAIFAESDASSSTSGSGVKTVSRVGLVIYGRTNGNTEEIASFGDITVSGFLTGGKIEAKSLVKNDGNTDFSAEVNFSVKTLFGKEVYNNKKDDRGDLYNVLPETERRFTHEWENTPGMGIFKVDYEISALKENRKVSKIVIIMPIYMIIIALILLTAFIAWAIILIRRRRERKSRLMV